MVLGGEKMDHPIIRKMERDGYLEEDEPVFYDFFGRPVYLYDNYFELDDGRFLSEELSQDAIEILINFGAIEKVCATNTDN